MKAIDRLYQYLDTKKVKPTNFERELGLSNGYLSSQKKRGADMGESIIIKITDYCQDLSLEWFLTGRGNMLRTDGVPTIQQTEPTIIYRDNPDKEEIMQLLREQNAQLKEQIADLKKPKFCGIPMNMSNTPPAEPSPLAVAESKPTPSKKLNKASTKSEIHT